MSAAGGVMSAAETWMECRGRRDECRGDVMSASGDVMECRWTADEWCGDVMSVRRGVMCADGVMEYRGRRG